MGRERDEDVHYLGAELDEAGEELQRFLSL